MGKASPHFISKEGCGNKNGEGSKKQGVIITEIKGKQQVFYSPYMTIFSCDRVPNNSFVDP